MGYQALLFCPDEKLAGVVSQVFSELDFTVEAVHEPFAAVKKLMSQRYDAVVVDSENEQNASLLFKSARNSTSNQGSLAIALVEGQMGVAKAYRIGANLVLTKPINVEQAKGTLRVARGLLRKSSDAAAASAGIAVPPATPAKPAATSAASTFQPANRGAATTAPPPNRREAPAPEAPHPARTPDPASAELPGAFSGTTVSAKVEDKPAVVPAPTVQPQKPVAPVLAIERRRPLSPGVTQNAVKNEAAVIPSASVPAQNTSSAFTSVPGSAAAPAPAKEATPPPAKENRIVESEPAAPSPDTPHDAGPDAAASSISDPVPTSSSLNMSDAPTFAALGEKDSGGSGGNKKTLIAAAAILALAAIGYFGYGYLVKPSSTAHPVSAPQDSTQPKPALRPTSTPTETPSQPAPNQATIATPTLATKTAAGVSPSNPNSPAGSDSSPEIRIAANVAPNHAASSEPEAKKRDAAPIFVKSNRPGAKTTSQTEESAPPLPSPPVVAAANDSNLSGLLAPSPSLAKPALATLKVSQGVSQGLLIKKVQPRYPQAALAVRAQGAVLIDATVTKDGNVTNLKVLKGDPILAAAALEAVRQWRYKPYYLDGAPVEIQTQITVNFNPN